MPMPFHMITEGETQGLISQGACEMQGREDTILCQELKHEVYIPHDLQSGLPTSKRVHKELVVTKVFDKSSPKLYQALTSGERMQSITLQFYRIDPTGVEEHYFTIKLTNAIIVSIRPWIPNALDVSKEGFTHMEDVSFTYRDIIWTWEPDGVESQDSWLVPRG
jgi:type VI secretion system secreted protein Hcp